MHLEVQRGHYESDVEDVLLPTIGLLLVFVPQLYRYAQYVGGLLILGDDE